MTTPHESSRSGDLQVTFEIFPNSPSMFTFLATPSGCCGPYTFLWDFGDGNMYEGSQFWAHHTYKQEGIYTITLTATATIYSGDTVSVCAPLQIIEVQKQPILIDPSQNTCNHKNNLDVRIANVSSRLISCSNIEKKPLDDRFDELHFDAEKLILRLATVIAAHHIPENKKFIRLSVSTGSKKRTVVAKNKENSPLNINSYIGRKVILVTNLGPLSLCNIKSQGMLLEDLGILDKSFTNKKIILKG